MFAFNFVFFFEELTTTSVHFIHSMFKTTILCIKWTSIRMVRQEPARFLLELQLLFCEFVSASLLQLVHFITVINWNTDLHGAATYLKYLRVVFQQCLNTATFRLQHFQFLTWNQPNQIGQSNFAAHIPIGRTEIS